jgi:hypothetical protein
MMELNLDQWALLFGALMPIVVGLVTKASAAPGLKAAVLLALELLTGVMTEYFASPAGYDWGGALVNALAAFVTGVAVYHGFLQHQPAYRATVIDATARFGLGRASRPGLYRGREAA